MRTLHANPPRHQRSSAYTPTALNTLTHVFLLADGVRHDRVSLGRIKTAIVEWGLDDEFFSFNESHHSDRVQSLPVQPVENSGKAETTTPPIPSGVLEIPSSRSGRAVGQPVRFPEFNTIFTSDD